MTAAPIARSQAIIDSHHHLWSIDENRQTQYLLPEYLNDLRHTPEVEASVFVQCFTHYDSAAPAEYASVGETAFADSVGDACSNSEIKVGAAIVGDVELLLGDAAGPVLDAHLAAAPKRLRGIRRLAAWDEHSELNYPSVNSFRGLLSEPQLHNGLRELARRDLHFETWVYHPQIDELTNLATRAPDIPIVLNHGGAPLGAGRYTDSQQVLAQWRGAMARLAPCDNVLVKIGGLISRHSLLDSQRTRDGIDKWTAETLATALKPIVLPMIELFSPQRCLFESNFPVDAPYCAYEDLVDAYSIALAELSDRERDAIFRENAARLYRINV